MYTVIACMFLAALGLIVTGLVMEYGPAFKGNTYRSWFKPALVVNLVLFVGALIALGFVGGPDAMAAATAVADAAPGVVEHHATAGLGLELIGIAVPTAGATIGAGVAVGQIGAASLGVVAEKPEMFGRTLIYLGLGEGIAIYGLVMSILMMGKM
jgi:V/A-type H+/Na+-transporting ATPase subunit K